MPQLTEHLQQQLRQILERDGRTILNTPKRLEALLREHCPENDSEIKLLMAAFAQGVPEKLMRAAPGVPPEVTYAKLTNSLQHNLALNPETARRAVDAWAEALGLKLVPATAMTSTTEPTPIATSNGAERSEDPLKNVHIEFKIDRDGKAVPYIPGHEPSRYKVEFHRGRIGGLALAAVIIYQSRRILSADTLQPVFEIYRDHAGFLWLVAVVIIFLSLFSVKKRFD
jgi:hypothetical protein